MASTSKITEILHQFPPEDSSSLIPVLQKIQEEFGYISERNVYAVSEYIAVPPSKIYGVATFYAQFRLKPLGRHVINLCRGTACHVKGSERLIPVFEQELKCKVGETTKDGRFTFFVVSCLGACSLGPVVNIDDDFYGNLKASEIRRILRKYD